MVMLNIKSLAILAFISLLFMMNLLLITKVHYVIDIAGGLIMAVWYFRLSTRISIYFDKLLTLPYYGVKWIYDNKCSEDEPEEP
jgi:membrane-associated phospholipid phosphatase